MFDFLVERKEIEDCYDSVIFRVIDYEYKKQNMYFMSKHRL